MKNVVRIRSFYGPYFHAFGLNTERHGVSLRIQSECGKIRTRKTPNMNTFYAVVILSIKISRSRCHTTFPTIFRLIKVPTLSKVVSQLIIKLLENCICVFTIVPVVRGGLLLNSLPPLPTHTFTNTQVGQVQ